MQSNTSRTRGKVCNAAATTMFRFCLLAMLLCLPLEGFADQVCEAEINALGQPVDGMK